MVKVTLPIMAHTMEEAHHSCMGFRIDDPAKLVGSPVRMKISRITP
jgi:hypothetical protein